MPTLEEEGVVGEEGSSRGRVIYRSWAELGAPQNGGLTCYHDDGRIAVNAELCAASRVYAAGSVAKGLPSRAGAEANLRHFVG